jgi:hypothetical protein
MNATRRLAVWFALLAAAAAATPSAWAQAKGQLAVRVVERGSGRPLAARMAIRDARGRAIRPPHVPFWRDYFVFDGTLVLELAQGAYTFELECGPEFKARTGNFSIDRTSNDTKTVEVERFVDMKKEGWWSGDLHIHRPPGDIELLMRAEDLHIGPVITWWNNQNLWKDKPLPREPLVRFDGDRFYHLLAGEDEREGGALLYFNLEQPLPIAGAKREYPSPIEFLKAARQTPGVHVDVEKPFWWDVPVWVATGQVDSIGLANNHQQLAGMLDNEAWGKPRDKSLFPSPHGNGRWSQHLYYLLLNCGLRIPPSTGSASGVLPNPVGYNRVYVYCGPQLDWGTWWQNLRRGQVIVTNGPLLRPRVFGPGALPEGALPGHVFQADAGQEVELNIALDLATRDKIEYLEIIQDGQRAHEVRLDKWAEAGGKLPPVKFTHSGWLLVRAVTNHPRTFRFASTGPYYVEIGYQRRVSRQAAQFFLDWVQERIERIQLDDPDQRQAVLQYHDSARAFWQKKVAEANAE